MVAMPDAACAVRAECPVFRVSAVMSDLSTGRGCLGVVVLIVAIALGGGYVLAAISKGALFW